jgi:translation initiation factor 2 alpha subunit (eIF-2alpha)
MDLEEGDVVLCTVDRIVGTVVFVKIEGDGEGSIILSEIAPGRIRNLRDYVVPKKKIVCKVLRISGDRIDMSLRRVTQKEQKEVIEQYKLEQNYISILKSVLKEKADKIILQIQEKDKVYSFLQEAKKDSKKLEALIDKEDAKKILDILNAQKDKKIIVKKEILLSSTNSDGLDKIKNLFSEIKDAEIKYLSAGRYLLKTESNDVKSADSNLNTIIKNLEEKAKKLKLDFKVK